MGAGCGRCGARLAEGEDACPSCVNGGDIVARCIGCGRTFALGHTNCPHCRRYGDVALQARLAAAQGYRELGVGNLYGALRSFEMLGELPRGEVAAWVGSAQVRVAGEQQDRVLPMLRALLRGSQLSDANQAFVYLVAEASSTMPTSDWAKWLQLVWDTKASVAVQAAEVARWLDGVVRFSPYAVPARLARAAAAHALEDEAAVEQHLVIALRIAPNEEVLQRALRKWLGERAAAVEAALMRDRARSTAHPTFERIPPLAEAVHSPWRSPLDTQPRDIEPPSAARDDNAPVGPRRRGNSDAERREQRFRQRLGPMFQTMERSVFVQLRRGGFIVLPEGADAGDADASNAPDSGLAAPESSAAAAERVRAADALAEAGDLPAARVAVEHALAVDIDAPGARERWQRWGAELRERELGRTVLVAVGVSVDVASTRRALCDLARELELVGLEPSAAVAWALAGDDAARVRLLGRAEVCNALAGRLLALVADGEGHGHGRAHGDGQGAPSGRARVAALVRDGARRGALREIRAQLAGGDDDDWLTEVGALLVTLAVRGPCLDVTGDDTLRLALGPRVTLGRRGSTIAVAGPGVAPEHLALWRDEHGVPVAADTGTATGTTLAGARLSAPLPVGVSLLLHLGGRVEVRASAPANAGPLLVEVGDARWCVPLGPACLDAHGASVRGAGETCWELSLADAGLVPATPSAAPTFPFEQPWVVANPAARGGGASRDVCFGDLLPCGDGFLPLEVRPPPT